MRLFALLGFLSAIVLTSPATELKKIGSEVDYSVSVLQEYTPAGATSSSNILLKNGLLYGGYIYKPASRDWQTIFADFQSKLHQAIKSDGWEIELPDTTPALAVPSRLIILARRGEEHLELNVWLFPVQDAKVGVSYTQGRR